MERVILQIKDGAAAIIGSLFEEPGSNPLQRVMFCTTGFGLYLFGLLRWAYFSNYGKISFLTADWYQEHAYYRILQSSLADWTIPFHTNQVFHDSNRFMALPELVLSPQILLLSVVDSIGIFVLLHFLVLFTIGFVGCVAVQRRFKLSTFSFSLFFGLFTFNGYITGHLSVGHTMWGGYFFLPFFFLVLMNIAEGRHSDLCNAISLAFVLFFVLLQGSIHVFAACSLYVILFFLFNPRFVRVLLLAFPAILVLNSFRLFPAFITYRDLEDPFLSGYPTILDVIRAFLVIERPSMEMVAGLSSALYWWELDVFIGVIAFGFLIYFGVYRSWRQEDVCLRFSAFNLPNVVVAVLALNNIYYLIATLPIPFANVERVPSRFLILPVVALLMIATVRLDHALQSRRDLRSVHLIALLCLAQTYLELMTHLRHWNVAAIDTLLPPTSEISIHTIHVADDLFYITSVKVSFLISAIGLVVCAALYLWSRRKRGAAVTAPRWIPTKPADRVPHHSRRHLVGQADRTPAQSTCAPAAERPCDANPDY